MVKSTLQLLLFDMLATLGPLTRRDIVKKLDEPRTTIYDHLCRLEKRGKVMRFTKNNGKRGRPLVFWKIKN